MEDNTKRRSSELEEHGVTPRPPPKKRFLSTSSSPSQSGDEDEDDGTVDTFKEPLEAFQKDAILRQWKDYTRMVKRLKKQLDPLERLKRETDGTAFQEAYLRLESLMNNVLNETLRLPSSSSQTTTTTTTTGSTHFEVLLQEEWVNELIPNMLNATTQYKDFSLINKLDKALEYHATERENKLTDFSSALDPALQREYKHSLTSWRNGQRSMMDLKVNCQSSLFKFLLLNEELKLLNRRLESTERLIHDTRIELDKITSSENTLVSETTAATTTSSANNSTESTIQNILDNQAFSENQLINVQQTLDQRLREIEGIKNDRIEIKQQIARLEMDLIMLPENRIYKQKKCHDLYNTRTIVKDKCNHLFNVCLDYQNKLDSVLEQRRRLIAQSNVSTSRMNDLHLKKLDSELMTVRSERDAFQVQFEEKKAAAQSPKQSLIELKVIADTRNELVDYLETELLRLQRKMAAKSGDKLYYDLYLKANPRQSIVSLLENDIRQLQEQVNQGKKRLLTSRSLEQLDTVSQYVRLEKEATLFEEKYGFHPSVSDEKSAIQILQDRIEKEKQVISEKKLKVTALEPTIQQLLEEIEKVIQLYPELEEQCVTKIQELAKVEEEIKQLQLERVKYSQTFTFLNKSKDAHTMVGSVLNKQVEKQLAHIRDMNERERNLVNQATCLDRELNTSNTVYEIYKQKNEESKANLKELEERSQIAKDKITELQKSILEKIQLVEEGAHKRLRVEESGELLRRKLESTNRTANPAEAELTSLKKDYLSLLNCTICETRLKSHALIRCMHTYCKQCLDDLIRSNSKVCPRCSEPFNASDVKQFF